MKLVAIWRHDIKLLFKEILPKYRNLIFYQMIYDEKILLLYHFYYDERHFYLTHFFIIHLKLKGLFNVWQLLNEFKISPCISLHIFHLNHCWFFNLFEIPFIITTFSWSFLLIDFFMDKVYIKENEHILCNHNFRIWVGKKTHLGVYFDRHASSLLHGFLVNMNWSSWSRHLLAIQLWRNRYLNFIWWIPPDETRVRYF